MAEPSTLTHVLPPGICPSMTAVGFFSRMLRQVLVLRGEDEDELLDLHLARATALAGSRHGDQGRGRELAAHLLSLECDFFDVSALDLGEELRVRDAVLGLLAHLEHLEGDQEDQHQDDPEHHRAQRARGTAQGRSRWKRRTTGGSLIGISVLRHGVSRLSSRLGGERRYER